MRSACPRYVALVGCIACAACGACGRGAASSAPLLDGATVADGGLMAAAPVDPVIAELWTRAKGGEADDLARLADREGESGLAARAVLDPPSRLTALRALAFAPDPGAFAALPLLAEAARGADGAQSDAALESAIDLAARPRRATDPEDAAEMKAGCDALLVFASDPKALRARRVKAIRALRMLADRGCVDPHIIPTDLDAR